MSLPEVKGSAGELSQVEQLADYASNYQNRVRPLFDKMRTTGLPIPEEEVRTTRLEYLSNLVLFRELGLSLNRDLQGAIQEVPDWLVTSLRQETDNENVQHLVDFSREIAAKVPRKKVVEVIKNLYNGLILDPSGDIAGLCLRHVFGVETAAYGGDRGLFRRQTTSLAQGMLSFKETRIAEDRLKGAYTNPEHAEAMFTEIFNHTNLVRLAGFSNINDFYERVYKEDIGKYYDLAQTVSEVMEEKYPKFLSALSGVARGKPEINDLDYFQLLALPPVNIGKYELYWDRSKKIHTEKPEDFFHPPDNIYSFIRNVVVASGRLHDREVEDFMSKIVWNGEDFPSWLPEFSKDGKLEELKVTTYLNYYGLYYLLEEIGHAVLQYRRDKKGIKKSVSASDEHFATAFQAEVSPRFRDLLKKSFSFAKDLPEDFGKKMEKVISIKRLFFLAGRAVQNIVEINCHTEMGRLARDHSDRLLSSVDDENRLPSRLIKSFEVQKKTLELAQTLYSRILGIPPENIPVWRLLAFMAQQYPEFRSGDYLRDMLGKHIDFDWNHLDLDLVKTRLEEAIGRYMNSI